MKPRLFSPMGSLHPILFFATVYLIALVFAIFICSSLFYSCNAKSADISTTASVKQVPADVSLNAVAAR